MKKLFAIILVALFAIPALAQDRPELTPEAEAGRG